MRNLPNINKIQHPRFHFVYCLEPRERGEGREGRLVDEKGRRGAWETRRGEGELGRRGKRERGRMEGGRGEAKGGGRG